jgi:signal transduction histidine kinase
MRVHRKGAMFGGTAGRAGRTTVHVRGNLCPCTDLADLVRRRRDTIQRRWVQALRESEWPHYAELPERELVEWTGRGLDAVVESLTTGSPQALKRHADHVSQVRRRLGFGIGEVVDGFQCLADAAVPIICAEERPSGRLVYQLHVALRILVAHFAEQFAQSARATVERNLEETRTLQQITNALLEKGELPGMLALVCRESRRLTEASGSAVLMLDGDERTPRAVVREGDSPEAADQLLADALRSTSDTPVEPMVFDDVAPEDAPPRERGHSLAAVPLRIHGELIGILQLVKKERKFREEDLRILARFADQAVIAIEHARLHERHEQTAILEERNRLARDLHDSVTQSLYAVTMFAEATKRVLEAGDTTAAVEHLEELRETATKALWEMRLLLFELRPADLSERGLASALQARLAAVENRAGLETRFECGAIPRLPEQTEEGVYRVAQEALANAIRHADASTIALRLTCTESTLRLEVEDDGSGFDLAAGLEKGGLGLRGMEERAAAMHGRIEIEAVRERGTRVVLQVPIAGGERAP